MPWRSLLYFLFIELCAVNYANAQFSDASEWLNIYQGGTEGLYGNGISLHDFNRDGLDDVTICTNGNGVRTYINNGDEFLELNLFDTIAGDIKQPVWVDYDNDDDADFFCTVYGGGCFLFRNDDSLQFTNVTSFLNQPSTNAKCFGASWSDYDRDGDLDVYVANYDFILPAAIGNWFFINQGDGSFVESAAALGIDNDYRASFQPAWCDVNFDGWPDLFVVNDKYHGNALYLNYAGVFTDVSESFNMNHAMESMSNSWCDFDMDGDYDVYVSNSTQGNKFLRNDGFYFTDIAAETETEVNSVCWNALWFDADHDLKIDLHVATNSTVFDNNQNRFFEFTESGSWLDVSIANDQRSVLSEAKGDINSDGFWDIVQVSEFPVSTACWMNVGGNNHYLKFSLRGTVSNADGIGAQVRAVVGSQSIYKTLFAGAGFISQDSKFDMISLKGTTVVDSLFVQWPSGWVDSYFALDADSNYAFVEGETFAVQLVASQDSICQGENSVISVVGAGEWSWQDGSAEQTFIATQPGWYSIVATHELGFSFADSIYIEEKSMPQFEIILEQANCFDDPGTTATLTSDHGLTWFLNDVPMNMSVDSLLTGSYSALVVTENGCASAVEFVVDHPEQIIVLIEYDTACFLHPTALFCDILGGLPPYSMDWNGLDPSNVFSGEYSVSVIDANGCTTQHDFAVAQRDSLSLNLIFDPQISTLEAFPTGGIEPYSFSWMNGATDSQIVLSADGIYSCAVTDSEGCSAEGSFDFVHVSEIHDSFIYFPIPCEGNLFIQSTEFAEIELFDVTGKKLMSYLLSSGINVIDLNALYGGYYFILHEDRFYPVIKR